MKKVLLIKAFDDEEIDFAIVCDEAQEEAIKKESTAAALSYDNQHLEDCISWVEYLATELEKIFPNITIIYDVEEAHIL